jgi:NADP-dependent 3-hydroxy acid dehydrogenase YdfG
MTIGQSPEAAGDAEAASFREPQDLTGVVALVTGASSGIGEATACHLARRGADVVLAARRADRLRAAVDRIEREGGRGRAIEADVTSETEADALVARTVDEFGRLDVLINNAGVMLIGPVVDAPREQWERMIAVNLQGVLYCARAALPHLLSAAEHSSRGVADMVNISSVSGRVVPAGAAVYAMTKHGIGAFSEGLRQEVAGRGVRVSLVEPGAVDTELRSHNSADVQAEIRRRYGGMELLRAADIAELILYIVTRPDRVALNELLIRPSAQVLP